MTDTKKRNKFFSSIEGIPGFDGLSPITRVIYLDSFSTSYGAFRKLEPDIYIGRHLFSILESIEQNGLYALLRDAEDMCTLAEIELLQQCIEQKYKEN